MIVSELIKALQKCPEDATVRLYAHDGKMGIEETASKVGLFEKAVVVLLSGENDDEWAGETVIYDHMKERG